ncbi:MAG: bi-domain-containing oxidoreductase, partial [Chloroflexota bacterium]|nr:bi-domain-containing oxidoreductase [Chloroflexota bacterium]
REGARHTYDLVRRKLAQEAAVGYSSAGRVIAVGPEVRGDFKPGDAVACAGSGHANHADIVAVPINLCAKVPDGVPLEAAAFSTIAAIAMHGVRLAEVSLGERVAVIGCGLIGKIACRLLLCAGAEPIAIDTNPSRVQDAHRSGVKHALVADGSAAELALAATSGQGADAVVITAAASSSAPLHLAAEISRDRGRLVLVGAVPIDFPRPPLYDKELSFRVSRSYGPGRYDALYEERGFDYPIGYVRWTEQRNMESVLALVADGRLKLLDLIERVVPVENAAGAYEQIADRATRGAIVLAYGDAPDPAPSAVTLIGAVTGNGANGAPVAARPAPALARPPRIGLIGAGSFAVKTIVPALTAAGAQLELVGGGGGPSAEAAQRTLGFARVAASESDVIDDDAVDAVVVCTRHASHARLVMRALERGKHVFCEKPLALTAPEVEDVIAAARASGAVLAAGFNRRFSPQLRE